jgi:hypothetical protein
MEKVLGNEHLTTLTCISNLAGLLELEVRVIETRKRVLGEEHPDTLTSMANLL